jgi:hypothetical protein
MSSLVFCMSAKPLAKRIRPTQVKEAIRHAQLICKDYERTNECRVAWSYVDDLSRGLRIQTARETSVRGDEWFSELETREYDL